MLNLFNGNSQHFQKFTFLDSSLSNIVAAKLNSQVALDYTVKKINLHLKYIGIYQHYVIYIKLGC